MWRRIWSGLKRLYFWTGILALVIGIISYLAALILNRTDLAVVGVGAGYIGLRLTFDYLFKLGQQLYSEAKPMFYRRSFQILGGGIIVFLAVTMYTSTRMMTLFTVLKWATAAFLLISGLGVVAAGYSTYWRRNLVLNTPTSTVRSLPIGNVEVKGQARSISEKDALQAPLTGEPCLGYAYKIQWFDAEEGWRTAAEDSDGVRFVLDDGTGQVLVNPDNATFYLNPTVDETVKAGEDRPDVLADQEQPSLSNAGTIEEAEDIIHEQHKTDLVDTTGTDARYIERRLHAGDPVYVFGRAQERSGSQTGTQNTDRLVITGEPGSFFTISNINEDALIEELGSHTWKKIAVGLAAIMLGLVGVLWSMGLISIPILL